MKVLPLKTRVLIPPKYDFTNEIFRLLKRIPERSIVALTSKAVSIEEGQCIPIASVKNKDTLIRREGAWYLPRSFSPRWHVMHTLKENLLMPTAGIDTSNGNGYYILLPKRPYDSARKYCTLFRRHYRTLRLGIIIVDSRSIPLRRGVVGMSLAHYGFSPMNDYRGTRDVFGALLTISQSNVADGLAASAALVMGEGREQQPLALITDVPFVRFGSMRARHHRNYSSFTVPLHEDLYAPFLKRVPWKRGGAVDKSKKPLIPLKKTQ